MGCTGSKPHLLLTSGGGSNSNGSGLAPSPQKGFILFNSKTLAYLRANQHEIKPALTKRCCQKMSSSNGTTTGSISKTGSLLVKTKKTNLIAAAVPVEDNKQIVEGAVDYVMNYALNEFDIDSFSRSNHLSMKQIRKDILKKATNDTTSEYVNTPFYKIALNTAIDEFGSYVKEHFIAINEFNAEKQAAVAAAAVAAANETNGNLTSTTESADADEKTTAESVTTTSEEEAAEALKLKEALEVARQNFYKGKVSLVCLSKHGEGYVVKEMQNQNTSGENPSSLVKAAALDTSASSNLDTSITTTSNGAETAAAPKINVEDVDASTNKDDVSSQTAVEHKSVSNMSVKSIPLEPTSRTCLDEFVTLKESMDMLGVMRETLECIVRYSTRPNDEEMDTREPTALTANLLKSARIIEAMRRLDEHDQVHCVDSKLVEGVLNLDYVVDEFRSYLSLVRHEISKRPESAANDEYKKCLDEMSDVVERVANAIENTPVKLFTSKGLPPPREINVVASKANGTEKTPNQQSSSNNSNKRSTTNDHENENGASSSAIDIKKEIAFSILNVGEVLAKTIDYYSMPSSESEELKELIKISEAQAAHEKKLATGAIPNVVETNPLPSSPTKPLQVNVNQQEQVVEEQHLKEEMPTEEIASNDKVSNGDVAVVAVVTTTTTSSSSALSSPTISTTSSAATSSAGSGSISPANNNSGKEMTVDENSTEQTKLAMQHDELAYLVDQISRDSNGEYAEKQQDEQQSQNQVGSSSSSDQIMTNSTSNNTNLKEQDNIGDEDEEADVRSQNGMMNGSSRCKQRDEDVKAADMLVQQFISNIIENASKRLSDGSSSGAEVEIEIEREQKPDEVVYRRRDNTFVEAVNAGGNKRMSLDEELMYQLEDVDKKVKYMNETCSENEDDEDEDDLLNGQQYDKDLDSEFLNGMNHEEDDDRLFQPARRPAEIKSNVRAATTAAVNQRRQLELHEEIKHISTVIQDLVQTLTPEKMTNTSTITNPSTPIMNDERKSLNNSRSTANSSIPVLRQRVLTKQKATPVSATAVEEIATTTTTTTTTIVSPTLSASSFKTAAASTTFESFVEFSSAQSSMETASPSNGAKFKSKLPVKK